MHEWTNNHFGGSSAGPVVRARTINELHLHGNDQRFALRPHEPRRSAAPSTALRLSATQLAGPGRRKAAWEASEDAAGIYSDLHNRSAILAELGQPTEAVAFAGHAAARARVASSAVTG